MGKPGKNVERLTLAGKSAAESGDNAEAEKLFLQVLAIDPEHLEAQVCLGFLLLKVQREREAYSFFKAALEIDPDSTDALRGFDIAAQSKIKESGDPKSVFDDRMDIVSAKLRKDVESGDPAALEFDKFMRTMGGDKRSSSKTKSIPINDLRLLKPEMHPRQIPNTKINTSVTAYEIEAEDYGFETSGDGQVVLYFQSSNSNPQSALLEHEGGVPPALIYRTKVTLSAGDTRIIIYTDEPVGVETRKRILFVSKTA